MALITGTALVNILIGTAGVDTIQGLGGNDQLNGLGTCRIVPPPPFSQQAPSNLPRS
jgi:hypothetical protein